MERIKFIHTADIHLGSFLQASEGLPPSLEGYIKEATMEGFRRVCQAAIDKDVDFMVISGDLYDREARSVKAMAFLVEECERLEEAGIDVIAIAGNHDPLRDRQELFTMPPNVKILRGNNPETHEINDRDGNAIARIIGQSYESTREGKKMHLEYRVPDRDIWNIALLHTQLEPTSSHYVPCSLGELKKNEDIHYWALGHIHKPGILSEDHPYIVYPGIPQGRDFGEQGRGGFLLVEADPLEGINSIFMKTAPIIYKRVDVFIDDDPESIPDELKDLEDRIYQKGCEIMETDGGKYPISGYIVEWFIRGRGPLHELLKEQEQESLELLVKGVRNRFEGSSPFLWTEGIVLRTQPEIDYEKLIISSPLAEEINRLSKQCIKDHKMKKKLIKELGDIWSHDGDHENRDDFRFHMDDDSLEELIQGAKGLIFEKIVEEREQL